MQRNDVDIRIGASADLKAFDDAINQMRGGLQSLSNQIPVVGGLLGGFSNTTLVSGAAVGGLALSLRAASSAAEEEATVFRALDATLRSTGNTTGLTRKEMDGLASSVEKNSLQTREQALGAISVLSTFRGVAKDTFRDVISLSADLSASFGGDLQTNARRIGRALQDIASGTVTDLRDGMEFLGTATIRTVTELANAGETAEATRVLMDELTRAVGGAAGAQQQGLTGAVNVLADEWDRLLTVLGNQIPQEALDNLSLLDQALLVFAGGGLQRAAALWLSRFNDEVERSTSLLGRAQDAAKKIRDLERENDSLRVKNETETNASFERARNQQILRNDRKIRREMQNLQRLQQLRGEQRQLDEADRFEAERVAALDARKLEVERTSAAIRSAIAQVRKEEADAALKSAQQESRINEDLESELRIIELKLAGRHDEAEVIEALIDLRARGKDLDDEALFFLEAQTREVVRQRQILRARNEEQDAAARAQEQALRAAQAASKELARQREQDFRDLSRNFFDLFSDQGASFWKAFKAAGLSALSDLSAQAVLGGAVAGQPAVRRSGPLRGLLSGVLDGGASVAAQAPPLPSPVGILSGNVPNLLAGAVPGVLPGVFDPDGAAKGVSKALTDDDFLGTLGRSFSDTFKGSFKEFGSLASDVFGSLGIDFGDATKGLSETLGQVGGGAATGFAAASVLKGLGIGGSQTGGAIGGAIGSFVPIPGAEIFGGLLGSILGGFLKSTPRGGATASSDQFGRFGIDSFGSGNGREEQAVAFANQTISTIEQIASSIGGQIASGINIGTIGTRGKKFTFDPEGRDRTKGDGVLKFGTQEEALAAQLSAALSRGIVDGVGATAGRILRSATSTTIEQVVEDAAKLESVPRRLKALTDPLGAALDDLNREFTDLRNTFLAVGASTSELAELEELFGLERERILKDQADAQSRVLRDFLETLNIGESSPLSLRDQRALIAPQFEAFEAQIVSGERIDQAEFTRVASQLLDIERQLSGSTAGFFALFDEVRELTEMAIQASERGGSGVEGVANPFPDLGAVEDATGATARETSAMRDLLERANDTLASINRTLTDGGGVSGVNVAFPARAFAR
ncbi:hypothetical protein JCM17845_15520 [Iodidimonas gelatinilytica]|uniref:Bacteriophage tail tape measure N-terminal domain-containing protein n=1 Tax=Iodidimonas gelatinilytica TaxID=1236966 RepID=A0A5A7N1A2_9PROT|nr:phage tail length tape measure family protein [Iodidimonas gelatinilytica]GER00929.1 hypothetical protein JCM17845_15520 [Iodidimonas gelatinilytica]